MQQQKKSLKPTLVLALDPAAAVFCAEVRRRLERQLGIDFGESNTLIQACGLVSHSTGLSFERDLNQYLDPDQNHSAFDLQAARGRLDGTAISDIEQFFERWQGEAEDALSDMLLEARSLGDIEAARRAGFEVVNTRLIYLVLSSVDPLAVGAVLELARLIRWLFATRFADELHTLHALVLLPNLFDNHTSPDYATTYTLLKKLDDAFANGLSVVAHQRPQPFESCWLIDGRNQRAVGTGTLSENLTGYADAFVGLLNANPEDSMASPGVSARGRPTNYNSFGYGELYLPSDVAVARLSAALSQDITRRVFLGEGAVETHDERQRLVAAKRFVQSKPFMNALEQTKRHREGRAIWQPFQPQEKFREETQHQYVSALRHRHEEFERAEMVEYRGALIDSGEDVCAELISLLDGELEQRANASPTGLKDVLEYLHILVEQAVELRRQFGEDPQNLLTVLRMVEGELDRDLGVVLEHVESVALLEQIHDLRSRLDGIRTDLRLLPAYDVEQEEEEQAQEEETAASSEEPEPYAEPEPVAEADLTFGEFNEDAPFAEDETEPEEEQFASPPPTPPAPSRKSKNPRRRLAAEIEEAEKRLRRLSQEYRRAVESEDTVADALRNDALKSELSKKQHRIEEFENALPTIAKALGNARDAHNDLLEEQQRFLRRHIIVRPSLFFLAVFGIPLLAAGGGIWPAPELVTIVMDNFSDFLLILLVLLLIYAAGVLWAFFRGLRPLIADAEEQVKQLSTQLFSTAKQLVTAHNEILHFGYKISSWRVRKNTVARLVEKAQLRIQELTDRLAALGEAADFFARERDGARPRASPMRRPLLLAEDIDAYYDKSVTNIKDEGDDFIRLHNVPRSQVQHITPEEFRARLKSFALARFEHLTRLSVTDAMFHRPDLVPEMTVDLRLRELNEAAEPLISLRQGNSSGTGRFAQRDTTLWASAQEQERLQASYRRICPTADVRAANDDSALRVLTRCLHFPAYFIGSIEFYRERYMRAPGKVVDSLTDLLPEEPRVKRARQRFLLAIATGVIVRGPTGDYTFANGSGELFGTDRGEIVERLSGSLSAQKLYNQMDARLDEHLSSLGSTHQRLSEFLNSATDLDTSERQILITMMDGLF
jgi:hypothetical protein